MKVLLSSGGAFWGVTAVFLILQAIFWYQIIKGSKSGTWVNDGSGGSIASPKNKRWYQNNFFKYFVIPLTIVYAIVLAIIYSDYK